MAAEIGTDPPPALSAARIVAEAIALLDQEGSKALSMRRLARHLGCGTMSIYHHIPDKGTLVEGIAEALMSQLDQPRAGAPWDDTITAMAQSFRQLAHSHPAAFELILAGRRPMALTRTATAVVEMLIESGFDPTHAETAFRTIIRFLLGSIVIEQRADAPGASSDQAFDESLRVLLEGVATLR